jgi:hypothetical protein
MKLARQPPTRSLRGYPPSLASWGAESPMSPASEHAALSHTISLLHAEALARTTTLTSARAKRASIYSAYHPGRAGAIARAMGGGVRDAR